MNALYPHLMRSLQNVSSTSIFSNACIRFSTAYKSSISLQNLYPQSNLNIITPHQPTCDHNLKFNGYIPMDKIEMTFSRSSGPGGQNVNKVNTKVDLRFHLESADWLSEGIKQAIAKNHSSKITKEGYLVFRSDVTRSQQLNVADCLEKLRCAIHKATVPVLAQPIPETVERLRRRHEKATALRLMVKRERSIVKQDRRGPNISDIL